MPNPQQNVVMAPQQVSINNIITSHKEKNMLTPISEVPVGSWFEYKGERFIKTRPFLRCQTTYQANSLVDGRPSFMMRTRGSDHPSIGTELVEVIPKLDWAIPKSGELRFETASARSAAFDKLTVNVPFVKEIGYREDEHHFIISYETTEACHLKIQSLFGGG